MKLKDSEVFTEETADRPRQMERAKEFLWSSNYLLSGFYIRFAEKKNVFFFQSDVSSWKIKLLENRQKSKSKMVRIFILNYSVQNVWSKIHRLRLS